MAKRTHAVNDRCDYDITKVTRLPAGVYTVSKDIENPNYDKRSDDFNRQPIIKAGTKVLVKDRNYRDTEGQSQPMGSVVSKLSGKSYARIEPDYFCYEPLMAALVRVEQTTVEEYLTDLENQNGYSACPEWVLQRLLKEGTVTRQQVEAAVAANDRQEGP